MARKTNISLVHPNEASKEIKILYNRIESMTGRVSPLWRAMAHKPEYIKLMVDKFELLFGKTKLDLRTKLLLYLGTSIMNNCEVCIHAFTERLIAMGVTDEEFVELYSVIDTASGMNTVANAAGITVKVLQDILEEDKT